MTVEVRVTASLQKLVGDQKAVVGTGETVGEVLTDLEQRYPGFQTQVLTEEGAIHRFVDVYLNDEDVRFLQKLDTPLREGDVLSILPALAGGGR
jgi:molybdopterin synthase sulfur carrier subunit